MLSLVFIRISKLEFYNFSCKRELAKYYLNLCLLWKREVSYLTLTSRWLKTDLRVCTFPSVTRVTRLSYIGHYINSSFLLVLTVVTSVTVISLSSTGYTIKSIECPYSDPRALLFNPWLDDVFTIISSIPRWRSEHYLVYAYTRCCRKVWQYWKLCIMNDTQHFVCVFHFVSFIISFSIFNPPIAGIQVCLPSRGD